jgi:hypothetical protein
MNLEEHHVRRLQYDIENIFLNLNSDKYFKKLRGMYIIPTDDNTFRKALAIISAEARIAICRVFDKYADNIDFINDIEVKPPRSRKDGQALELDGWKIESESEDI